MMLQVAVSAQDMKIYPRTQLMVIVSRFESSQQLEVFKYYILTEPVLSLSF